jgi:hypothetical protein
MKLLVPIIALFQRVWQYYWHRKVERAAKVLKGLDSFMKRAGYSRSRRRQFWRAFVNSQKQRDFVITELEDGR